MRYVNEMLVERKGLPSRSSLRGCLSINSTGFVVSIVGRWKRDV